MDATINGFRILVSRHATKNKVDPTRLDLNLLYTIKKDGYVVGTTQFLISDETISAKEWGGAKRGMKGTNPRAVGINTAITKKQLSAKELLTKADERFLKTPQQIKNYIQTTIRTTITKNAPRGKKKEYQDRRKQLTIDGIFEQMKRRPHKPLKPKKQGQYRSVIKTYHDCFNHEAPTVPDTTKQDLRKYQTYINNRFAKKASTRQTYLGIIAAIFNFAAEEDNEHRCIEFAPLPKGFVPTLRKKDLPERNILEKSDTDLLAAIPDEELKPVDRIAKYTCMLQLATGMAYCDVLTLERKHVRFTVEKGLITKPRAKSDEIFMVPLNKEAKRALNALNGLAGGSTEYYFENLPDIRKINRAYKRLAKRVSMTRFTSYDLRHTFAVRWMEDPKHKLEDLMKMMGHAKIETTMIYAKILAERLHIAFLQDEMEYSH